MDFTREPIIESVITPRDGCKLVVRSSKGVGQEEYFVDSLEIVSFGGSFFYRSLERPKAFLMPVSDYEVLEARETRVVLKSATPEKGAQIRIGGSRKEKEEEAKKKKEAVKAEKGRRRSSLRRRGKEDGLRTEETAQQPAEMDLEGLDFFAEEESSTLEQPPSSKADKPKSRKKELPQAVVSSLLPPPKNLIRDTMDRYREDEQFSQAFFSDDDPLQSEESLTDQSEQQMQGAPDSVEEEPENASPFGEGDGLVDPSGESGESESEAFVPDESHWIIPDLSSSETFESSSQENSQKE